MTYLKKLGPDLENTTRTSFSRILGSVLSDWKIFRTIYRGVGII
jgi:hypothetical protein